MPTSLPTHKFVPILLLVGVAVALLLGAEFLDLTLDHLRGDIGE